MKDFIIRRGIIVFFLLAGNVYGQECSKERYFDVELQNIMDDSGVSMKFGGVYLPVPPRYFIDIQLDENIIFKLSSRSHKFEVCEYVPEYRDRIYLLKRDHCVMCGVTSQEVESLGISVVDAEHYRNFEYILVSRGSGWELTLSDDHFTLVVRDSSLQYLKYLVDKMIDEKVESIEK